MPATRIAVVSDVHGNLTAFRAVLADLAGRGVEQVINLGDVAGKGPRGSACVALTRQHCQATVRGNWDTMLAGVDPTIDFPSGRWWHEELSTDDRAWLAGLPNVYDLTISGRRIRLVHASATSEFHRVHFHHTPDDFAAMFAVTDFTGPSPAPDVVVYGDIHDSYLEVEGGLTLVNAGSVGNPLDEPAAAYLIIEGMLDSAETAPFLITHVRVPYDIEAEVAHARTTTMTELDAYVIELRTAVYRGRHPELGLTAD